jgi:hypothetical protein
LGRLPFSRVLDAPLLADMSPPALAEEHRSRLTPPPVPPEHPNRHFACCPGACVNSFQVRFQAAAWSSGIALRCGGALPWRRVPGGCARRICVREPRRPCFLVQWVCGRSFPPSPSCFRASGKLRCGTCPRAPVAPCGRSLPCFPFAASYGDCAARSRISRPGFLEGDRDGLPAALDLAAFAATPTLEFAVLEFVHHPAGDPLLAR